MTFRDKQLSLASASLVMLMVMFALLGFAVFLAMQANSQALWCPAETFDHHEIGSRPELIVVGFILVPSLLSAPLGIACRANLLKHNDGSTVRISNKAFRWLILIGLVGVFSSFLFGVDAARRYECTTPTRFVIRRGYFTNPHERTWADVRAVRAWCSATKQKGRPPSLDAGLTLSFRDGENLTLALVDGGRPLVERYGLIRASLAGKSYSYYKSGSVDPSECPSDLLPLLRDWTG